MKKLIYYSFIILFLMSACSDDKKDDEIPEPPEPEVPIEPELPSEPFSDSLADQSFFYFNQAFLAKSKTNRYYYRETLTGTDPEYFWCQALCILMAEDAYDVNPQECYKDLIHSLLYAFLEKEHGSRDLYDWDWNEYNDDLLWAGLAFIRGYLITDHKPFLDQAVYAWNRLYNRGWDTSFLGGGIWWDIRNREKSALSNNPAVSMACYLYKATGNGDYLKKAEEIYDWSVSHLFDEASGAVWENWTKGQQGATLSCNTYSSGAFIEAANLLYQITKKDYYFKDAEKAIEYVMNVNADAATGIMWHTTRDGTNQSEFARGMGMFVRDNNLWDHYCEKRKMTYYEWMRLNAVTAWSKRNNSLNITWNDWRNTTPNENKMRALECVGAVCMCVVAPENKP